MAPSTDRRAALTRLTALAATAALPALPGCQTPPAAFQATDPDTAVAWLRSWLAQRLQGHAGINLSLAVLHGERVVWATAHGQAQPARDGQPAVAATPRTRYRAGSVSKVVVALAAMKLVAQGRLSLDAPLALLLPGWRPPGEASVIRQVTPRLILSHHSGLPTDLLEGMWTDTPEDTATFLAQASTLPLAHAPGEVYAYSNLGFALLGAAIARLTGQPLATWLNTEVLQPLGMADSAFETAPPSGPMAAQALDDQGRPAHEWGLRDLAAGGLNTTALDLLQLGRLWWGQGTLAGQPLWTPASLQAMHTPQQPERLQDTATVGLGWHLITDEFAGLGPVLWHAGGTLHHHSELVLLPRLQLAMAVLTSADGAAQLAHDVAVEGVRRLGQALTGTDPLRPPREGADPAWPPVAAATLRGLYDTPLGVVHAHPDGRLTLPGEPDAPTLHLRPRPDGYLRLQYRLLGLLPVGLGQLDDMAFTQRPAEGTRPAWLLVRRQGRFMLSGIGLQPTVLDATWRARLGRYRYAGDSPFLRERQAQQAIRLVESDGLLVLVIEGYLRAALQPTGPDTAVVAGLGRSRGDTVHFSTTDGHAVMRYSGMTLVATAR